MTQRRHGHARRGTHKYLGLFTSELEAARTYDAAAALLHGENAMLNFPKREAA